MMISEVMANEAVGRYGNMVSNRVITGAERLFNQITAKYSNPYDISRLPAEMRSVTRDQDLARQIIDDNRVIVLHALERNLRNNNNLPGNVDAIGALRRQGYNWPELDTMTKEILVPRIRDGIDHMVNIGHFNGLPQAIDSMRDAGFDAATIKGARTQAKDAMIAMMRKEMRDNGFSKLVINSMPALEKMGAKVDLTKGRMPELVMDKLREELAHSGIRGHAEQLIKTVIKTGDRGLYNRMLETIEASKEPVIRALLHLLRSGSDYAALPIVTMLQHMGFRWQELDVIGDSIKDHMGIGQIGEANAAVQRHGSEVLRSYAGRVAGRIRDYISNGLDTSVVDQIRNLRDVDPRDAHQMLAPIAGDLARWFLRMSKGGVDSAMRDLMELVDHAGGLYPEMAPALESRKVDIVRDLLGKLRDADTVHKEEGVLRLINGIRTAGIDWDELDTMEDSLRSGPGLDEDRDDHGMDDGDDRHERMIERMREDVAEVMDVLTNTTKKTGIDRIGTASDAMYDLVNNEVGLEMLEDALREDRHWVIANLVTAFFLGDNRVLRNLISLLEETPVNWPELRDLPNSVKHLVEVEFNNMLAGGELADSIDAARSMAATGLWSEDELMREISQAYSHDPGTWLPSGKDTRTIRRNLAAMPVLGATADQVSRMLDKNKPALVRSLLVDIKKDRIQDASMLISDLMARGKNWPELDAMLHSINADSETTAALREDLGNLAALGVGGMINLLRQSSYSSRRYGSNIGDIGRRFHGQDIGSTSEILDMGTLKQGIKGLRKAFREHQGAMAFAVYIGGKAVMFGVTDSEQLAGSSRESKIAYDLTPYADMIAGFYTGKGRPASASAREEPRRSYDQPGDSPRRYAGQMQETSYLSSMLDLIDAIGRETKQPVTFKLVMSDREAASKRHSRRQIQYELSKAVAPLKDRLAIYKNSKRPTVDNIRDFIRMSLQKRGSTVRFANNTYRLSTEGYETMKIEDLLRGKKFTVSYGSVEPQNYDSVTVTYAFSPQQNQLIPITATWNDRGSDGKSNDRVEAIVDPTFYVGHEIGPKYADKDHAIPVILRAVKANDTKKAANLVSSLEQMGIDWPELGAIKQSLEADGARG